MRKLLFGIFVLALGPTQIVSAVPSAKGSAKKIIGASSDYRFWLKLKIVRIAKPGIQFYPMIRIVFVDGTWIDGALGCFPTGVENERQVAGDAGAFAGIGKVKPVKQIELVARIGDPTMHFSLPRKNPTYERLDDATLKRLLDAGGFVIRLPIAVTK